MVGSIIVLAEPLLVDGLATLLGKSLQYIDRQLSPLHSVLRIPDNDHTPVRTLHLSFTEFLLSEKVRKQAFGIDGPDTHLKLSRRYFEGSF